MLPAWDIETFLSLKASTLRKMMEYAIMIAKKKNAWATVSDIATDLEHAMSII
jgi:hypothetical protein